LDFGTLSITAILSLLPIFELRGAIPYAIANELPVVFTYFYCVFLNALVGPLVYLFLSTLHKVFSKFGWYNRFFGSLIERSRRKLEKKVDRFGYLGIVLFVAIPLPITGAYTGTLGAWILGMDAKKTFLAVLLGVVIAGIIVTLIMVFGVEALSFFINKSKA
jgi:uncharacterized membrane protein